MQVTSKLDYSNIPIGQEFNIRLLLKLTADEIIEKNRSQLNISMVLDRSGSMAGEKLEYVKNAAVNLINRLDKNDYCSLVVFDNIVSPLIPPALKSKLSDFEKLIKSVAPGGNTFLSGGYKKGFEFAKQNADDKNLSRIILLTDGQANSGIVDPVGLSDISKHYLKNGVSTTTIGVGADYNEYTLDSMSSLGGGNTYYLENPSDAESIFTEELGYLLNLTVRKCTVKLNSKIKGLEAGQLNDYLMPEPNTFMLDDLYSGKTKSLVFEILIPPQFREGIIDLGELIIEYEDVSGKEFKQEIIKANIKIGCIKQEAFLNERQDLEVMKEVVTLLFAKALKQSIYYANQGDFNNAAASLAKVIQIVEHLGLEDDEIVRQLTDMKEKERNFRDRGFDYYDHMVKKRMYYDMSYSMKGKKDQLNMMMDRREKYDRTRNTNKLKNYDFYFIVDINTTGLPINNHAVPSQLNNWPRIVQIAWDVLDKNFKTIEKKSYIIKPEGFQIPDQAANLHGITTARALKEGVKLIDVFSEIKAKNILNDSTLFVTFNEDFVRKTIESEIYRLGFALSQMNWLDIMMEAKKVNELMKQINKSFPSLDELYSFITGTNLNNYNYDAAVDVKAIKQSLVFIKGKVENNNL